MKVSIYEKLTNLANRSLSKVTRDGDSITIENGEYSFKIKHYISALKIVCDMYITKNGNTASFIYNCEIDQNYKDMFNRLSDIAWQQKQANYANIEADCFKWLEQF